jgi:hypothetical protein
LTGACPIAPTAGYLKSMIGFFLRGVLIMRSKIFRLAFILAGSSCLVQFANADVLKCRAANGGVSYTNGLLCTQDEQSERIISDNTSFTPEPAIVISRIPESRQTAWATRQITVVRHRPDVESIRAARLKTLAMDRLPPYER